MMIRCAEGARCAQRAWRISLHLIRFSPFNLITKLITSCGAGVRPSLEGLPYPINVSCPVEVDLASWAFARETLAYFCGEYLQY